MIVYFFRKKKLFKKLLFLLLLKCFFLYGIKKNILRTELIRFRKFILDESIEHFKEKNLDVKDVHIKKSPFVSF